MNYRIRRAEPKDVDKVIELAVEAVTSSISPYRDIPAKDVQEFRRKDLATLHDAVRQPHVGIFLAEDGDGRLLGHVITVCGYLESSTGESQAWIFDMAVVPDAWSQGIGQALMHRAEAFARQMGYVYLGLGVTSANERAVRFYEKLGFGEERKRMLKHLGRTRPSPPPPVPGVQPEVDGEGPLSGGEAPT